MKKFLLRFVAVILTLTATLSLLGCENSDIFDDISDSQNPPYSGTTTEPDDNPPTGGETLPEEVNLTFVAINDLHGSIEQDENKLFGISNTAAAIDKLSNYYGKGDTRKDIVLFGNGDMFQGTAISNLSKGRAIVEAMNDMRFDAIGIGNHEFDWGIEVITNYFDGDASNGEANFPLVNANVYKKSAGKYLADISNDDNIVNGTIVDKSGVKVGLISVIGPCENSILATRVKDYSFTHDSIVNRVKQSALSLKEDGAQIISVNVHYDSEEYDADFAAIEDNGDYLIDIIFNGHKHRMYSKTAKRPNGQTIPVLQGGSNNNAFAYTKLTYNTVNGTIVYNQSRYQTITQNDTAFDQKVENTVTNYQSTLIDSLPVLAVSAITVYSQDNIANYVANVGLAAIGSDYFTSNYAGLRSTGDITEGKPIKEDAFYKIIPFDNELHLVEIQGDALYRFYQEEMEYDYFGTREGAKTLNSLEGDTEYYTLAVIDYVYTGKYFEKYKEYVRTSINTKLQLRDLLVQDAIACHNAGKRWGASDQPTIGLIYTE